MSGGFSHFRHPPLLWTTVSDSSDPGAAPRSGHRAARSGDAAPAAPAAERPAPAPAARSGKLILARETKHRGGKAVVIVRGFAQLAGWDADAVAQLARELKQTLGCGGTVDAGPEIVLQGDRPAQVAEWLRTQGFRVHGVTS